MQYRITTGTDVLALAASLVGTTDLPNLTVDGAFLVFELPADTDSASAAVTTIGEAISALRDEALEDGKDCVAYTTLINTAMGLLRDIERDFNVKAENATTAEANAFKQESRPTLVTEPSSNDASKQSSDETQERNNEAEPKQQETKQVNAGTGSNGRK